MSSVTLLPRLIASPHPEQHGPVPRFFCLHTSLFLFVFLPYFAPAFHLLRLPESRAEGGPERLELAFKVSVLNHLLPKFVSFSSLPPLLPFLLPQMPLLPSYTLFILTPVVFFHSNQSSFSYYHFPPRKKRILGLSLCSLILSSPHGLFIEQNTNRTVES